MTPASQFPLYLSCIILPMNSDERGSVPSKWTTCSCNYKVTLKDTAMLPHWHLFSVSMNLTASRCSGRCNSGRIEVVWFHNIYVRWGKISSRSNGKYVRFDNSVMPKKWQVFGTPYLWWRILKSWVILLQLWLWKRTNYDVKFWYSFQITLLNLS